MPYRAEGGGEVQHKHYDDYNRGHDQHDHHSHDQHDDHNHDHDYNHDQHHDMYDYQVTAITILTFGTSQIDLFASKVLIFLLCTMQKVRMRSAFGHVVLQYSQFICRSPS